MFPMLYLKCIGSNTEINDVKESVNFFFRYEEISLFHKWLKPRGQKFCLHCFVNNFLKKCNI